METIEKFQYRLAAVILSLTLPEEKGLETLKALQKEKEVWHVPIIATGPANARLEKEALSNGADEYVDKPHFQESLYKQVHHAIKLMESQIREQELKTEAYRDYMTGLLNRRGLEGALRSLRREDALWRYICSIWIT